nr:MAG TPA: hypothetical protein [Crassvirales sp.]
MHRRHGADLRCAAFFCRINLVFLFAFHKS